MNNVEWNGLRVDPHVWRKFQQAQRNMLLNISKWKGRRVRAKDHRRTHKWARAMGRWFKRVDLSISNERERQ